MTSLKQRVSPKDASITESKVCLSMGRVHSAFAMSKLLKMIDASVPSIGCTTSRSGALPICIQVNSSMATLRTEPPRCWRGHTSQPIAQRAWEV